MPLTEMRNTGENLDWSWESKYIQFEALVRLLTYFRFTT